MSEDPCLGWNLLVAKGTCHRIAEVRQILSIDAHPVVLRNSFRIHGFLDCPELRRITQRLRLCPHFAGAEIRRIANEILLTLVCAPFLWLAEAPPWTEKSLS